MAWNPEQYLKFADHRLRPAIDLLNRIDVPAPSVVYDLGCGAGNVTRLLRARWPEARIVGIDSSPEMLDHVGRITLLNATACSVLGWNDDAVGRPLDEVFRIVNEDTREPVESPVRKVLRDGKVAGLANHTVLVRRDGSEAPIDDSGAPIRCLRAAGSTALLIAVRRIRFCGGRGARAGRGVRPSPGKAD